MFIVFFFQRTAKTTIAIVDTTPVTNRRNPEVTNAGTISNPKDRSCKPIYLWLHMNLLQ